MADSSKDEQPATGSTDEDRGGSQRRYSPNDDRSMIKNSTDPSFKADQKNREDQKKTSS